jgi:hypothetical protein
VLLPFVLGVWRSLLALLLGVVAYLDTLGPLRLLYLLDASLSLLGFHQQLLLVLLLTKPMQEFVGLSQNLRHQGVFVEVFDIEHFTIHFVALVSCLVNIG